MSNFDFLHPEWAGLYADSMEAEKYAIVAPKFCAILCRSALEKAVHWLYQHDSSLREPYDSSLNSLIHEQCLKNILKPHNMFREINLIRQVGNNAAHGKRVETRESIVALKNLFRFLSFIAVYYSKERPTVAPFDSSLIPDGTEREKSQKELRELQERLAEENATIQQQAKVIEELKREIAERKVDREQIVDEAEELPLLVSELETRRLYIDLLLKEAGWDNLRDGYELEYEVVGMPLTTNPTGLGYADYVLWGDDSRPLAVIEAKKTIVEARKGRHQAELYADCLEQMHGQRPVIFYTNGFETYIWDDLFYPDREVSGFYTKDELLLLIDRRATRKDLRTFSPNPAIAGRPYQIEAIQRVAEHLATQNDKGQLRGRSRKALLVMATGSGKTRTAISLVDMLTKCNWVKRVLFLADRNALVTQAKDAFKDLLENLTAIDLTKEKEDPGTRLVFSTYPTIMNRIDAARTEDVRFYSPGHFDLIIIDEAHRSVYQKYHAIFDYFDSLLIGLTATPKKEVDHQTYGLFEVEDDNPTFAYELNQAVEDGFLVPARGIGIPIKFPEEGIRYKDLSDREKAEYEEKFGDPTQEEAPEEISGSAINTWLFNTDTVDKVLDYLMKEGIKVEGGDKLGKTIIFAKNHKHAVFIEQRFNKAFPQYTGKFLRVIDNYESKAQDLLETFKDAIEDKNPQISVSVDMMDTGVDAPRVVNLVFFKLVRSQTKFWQMIGRGTRLCPNLFGPGEDKTHFIIFDFCKNFDFFDGHPAGIEGKQVKTLTQQAFEAKLELALLIREADQKTEQDSALAEAYAAELHSAVQGLDQDRFVVKKELRAVTEYSTKGRWQNISQADMQEINTHISRLMIPQDDDHELSRRFDVFILRFQIALFSGDYDTETFVGKLNLIATALKKKTNIPMVKKQEPVLNEIQTESFWQGITVNKLEEVRHALRDLIKFMDREKLVDVFTSFTDELKESEITVRDVVGSYSRLQSYRDRVEAYIRKNKDHITIRKLQMNKPITKAEIDELERLLFDGKERGTKEDYIREIGEQPLGKFIRSIIGLDQQAVHEAFSEFLLAGNLRADQMRFLDMIIKYLMQNGTLEKGMLFEAPFTDINDQGLQGVFDDAQAMKVIKMVEGVNRNAVAA
ncbi:DEAD/DEAH box helicase family protein [Myxococcota bacterium]|nr:DEAD/DEAH box helicase family protein [Myxococcota bacterium]